VFRPAKTAVFVVGCFWHSGTSHRSKPKTNSEWCRRKLESVQARDRHNGKALEGAGWKVVRVWEHEDPSIAADRIERIVKGRQLSHAPIEGETVVGSGRHG
jgi:DNA mismatch endonuclease (patch repair protein)